jgi:outer membrane protein assembly factor BamE
LKAALLPTVLILSLIPGLSACGFVGFPGVYKIDVEQGNLVTQDMVDQLQPGMSRRQVRFIMGSPLVEDTFNPNRWAYPYVIRNGQDVIREARVIILFAGDSLSDVLGDYLPGWASGAVTGEAAADGASAPESDNGTASGSDSSG